MVQGVGKTVIELLFPTFPLKSSRVALRRAEERNVNSQRSWGSVDIGTAARL